MENELRDLIEVARHSPSSHNTQPWKLTLQGNDIIIGYDPARQLRVGDPEKRELIISLGCFTESLVLAAVDHGYSGDVSFVGTEPDGVVKVRLRQTGKPSDSWQQLILARRSDRRFYENRRLSQSLIDELQAISYGGAQLIIFSQPTQIKFLGDVTYQATYEIMSDAAFRSELASWVRHNWTRQDDGMPAYTQGMPALLSLIAKPVIKKNPKVAASQAKKDSQRVLRSAAVGLITVTENTPADWLAAGRLYQKACLLALAQDVKSAAVSAAVINTETARAMSEQLELPGSPVALIRFGYKKGVVRPSPRRLTV